MKIETAPDKPTFVLVHCAQVFAKQNTELSIISGQRIIFGAATRSSWLNCALRDDEAVYWVSIGHYEAVAVGN